MNVGKKAIVIDEGHCFSFFTGFAKQMGHPEAASENIHSDARNGLENGDEVTILAEGNHPNNGEIDPSTEEIIDYGKLFIVQKSNCKYIINEKGLKMPVNGFMEDWDGEVVLSDIRNFKSENDFVQQAQIYIDETRGYHVPIMQPTTINIVYNGDLEECWMEKKGAIQQGFEGETITVFKSNIDWENSEGHNK